jgi:DNA-binding beta-propeller fold protein YncE
MLDDLRGLGREPALLADAWDDLTRGGQQAPIDLDPILTGTIREFHDLADGERSEGPDPAFVHRLLDDLTASASRMQGVPRAIDHRPRSSPNGRSDRSLAPAPVRLPASRRSRFAGPLATAALLLLTLTASLIALGPLRPGPDDRELAPPVSSLPAFGPVEFVAEIRGTPEYPFFEPHYVNVDPEGNLWVTDDRYGRFLIFAPDGTFREAWGGTGSEGGGFDFVGSGHGYGFGDIAWDADGNLYVVDAGNARVQKFDRQRQFVLAWGGEGTADGQFLEPVGIAIGDDDRIYVTDTKREDVQIFDTTGRFLGRFGGFGVGEGQFLSVVGGIAFDRAGNVIVADYEGDRLHRFDRDGRYLGTWGRFGGGDGEFARPDSVVVDAAGRMYVTDNFNHRVQILAADGRFLSAWGTKGSDIGQFVYPAGIAFDRAGNIYVVDSGNDRIQKFRLLPPVWPGSVMLTESPGTSLEAGPP